MNLSKRMIAPSILSADFTRLHEEIQDVEHGGCDSVHVDVMDGHFVPNLTIGPPVIRWIRKTTKLPLDVHLMITEPIQSLKDFREAGADWITIHVEACRDVKKTLEAVHSLGAQAGLSLRPKTDVKTLMPYLGLIDFVLVMTVEPGFGGQEFMPQMLEKVCFLKKNFSGPVSVDGGINSKTIREAAQAGADIFVVGSAIFKEKNRKKTISEFRKLIA